MYDRPDVYLNAYRAVHLDVARRTKKRTEKLKCRPGYEQRGSACQKISIKKPMNNSEGGNNLAKTAAAIGLAGLVGGGVYLATRKKEEPVSPVLPEVIPSSNNPNRNKQIALGVAGLGVAGAGAALALKGRTKEIPKTSSGSDIPPEMGDFVSNAVDELKKAGIDEKTLYKGFYYESVRKQADQHLANGDLDAAIKDYDKVISYGEGKMENCEALLGRGNAYLMQAKTIGVKEVLVETLDKAIADFNKCAEEAQSYSLPQKEKSRFLANSLTSKAVTSVYSDGIKNGFAKPIDNPKTKQVYENALKDLQRAIKLIGLEDNPSDSDETKALRQMAKEASQNFKDLLEGKEEVRTSR